jgi:hypothetical protein
MNKKFKIEVWIEAENKYFQPTIYTIDIANDFIAFDWMGKSYQVSLDEVHSRKQ